MKFSSIDRAEQLRSLECSVVYTVPISLMYSSQVYELSNLYDSSSTNILPMISIRNKNGSPNQSGLSKMQNIIQKRMEQCAPDLKLVPDVFESQELVEQLCMMTGGYVRSLMILMQHLSMQIDDLPIDERALKLCFSKQRRNFLGTVKDRWDILAATTTTRNIKFDNDYRELLYKRCILHYCYIDDENEF